MKQKLCERKLQITKVKIVFPIFYIKSAVQLVPWFVFRNLCKV
jgi:hypothetical protein